MIEQATPAYRLQKAREREHVVSALQVAQQEWRRVLEIVEAAETTDAAADRLRDVFGLTQVQATAVLETQFKRVGRDGRERIDSELSEPRAEIAELEEGSPTQ